jgi:hypothetical protein
MRGPMRSGGSKVAEATGAVTSAGTQKAIGQARWCKLGIAQHAGPGLHVLAQFFIAHPDRRLTA